MPFDWAKRQTEVKKFANSGGLPPDDQQCWTQYRTVQSELQNIQRYIHHNADVSDDAAIIGPVHIESGAQVLPGAYVEGPSYIGKNALVGTSTLIREGSFLGSESIIGNHCHVTSAVIGPGTGVFHHNGISRSIIGRDCHITIFVATGTTRPDLKPVVPDPTHEELDVVQKRGSIIRKGTYIAPHVIINPNISIGENCAIGPFVQVSDDIDDGKYVKTELSTSTRENKLTDVQISEPPNYPFEEEFQ